MSNSRNKKNKKGTKNHKTAKPAILRAADAGKSSKSEYKDIIIRLIITLMLGGLFGDFIVKRNIEGYSKELTDFESAPENANQEFNTMRNFYNSRLRERRLHTQQISKYIYDDSITEFDENYAAYEKTVRSWNSNLISISKSIQKATKCHDKYKNFSGAERSERFAEILNIDSKISAHKTFTSSKPKLKDEIRDLIFNEEWFCPTLFLTKSFPYSVHNAFKNFHRKIYNYRVSKYSDCRLRHIRNTEHYYRSCTKHDQIKSIKNCMQNYDRMIDSGFLCKKKDQLDEFKISNVDFSELDFYWDLGDSFFRSFREDFLIRECKSKIRFWGKLLGWNCESSVEQYLARL